MTMPAGRPICGVPVRGMPVCGMMGPHLRGGVMAGDRFSRRDVLGGLVSAAAVGVAGRGSALAGPAVGEVRRSGSMLRLGSNENATGLGPAARAAFLAAVEEANRYPGGVWQTLIEALT